MWYWNMSIYFCTVVQLIILVLNGLWTKEKKDMMFETHMVEHSMYAMQTRNEMLKSGL
jgi:FtsZ-interacting cell division protein ZipA